MMRVAFGAMILTTGILLVWGAAASHAQTPGLPPAVTATTSPSPASATPSPAVTSPLPLSPPGGLPVLPPPAPALAYGCGRSGPLIQGGRSTGLGTGELMLAVDLPAPGTYFTLPGGTIAEAPALFICHVQSDSSITISAVTGREVSRTARDQASEELLNRIVASARLTQSPRPAPILPATPSVLPGGVLRPPFTGDGGLQDAIAAPE